MLVTKEEVFKRFWYPVMPTSAILEQPQSFELLGKKLVLWLDNSANAVVSKDRCCHCSAQLSKGEVIAGNIACPYHGWQYNAEGVCVKVPQLEDSNQIPKTYQIKTYLSQERYGYIWVCLGELLNEIPDIAEVTEAIPAFLTIFFVPFAFSIAAGLSIGLIAYPLLKTFSGESGDVPIIT